MIYMRICQISVCNTGVLTFTPPIFDLSPNLYVIILFMTSWLSTKEKEQVKAMAKSFGRTFAAAALAQLFATGTDILSLDAATAKMIISSGLSAALLVFYNSLNPKYTAYGKGAK